MSKSDLALQVRYAGMQSSPVLSRNLRLWLSLLLLMADGMALLVGFSTGIRIAPHVSFSPDLGISLSACMLVFAMVAFNRQAYDAPCLTSATISCRTALTAFAGTLLIFLLVLFAIKEIGTFSRLAVIVGAAGSAGLLLFQRTLIAHAVRRRYGGQLMAELLIVDGCTPPPGRGNVATIDAGHVGFRADVDDPFMLHRLGMTLRNYDRVVVACPLERRKSWAQILKGANVQGEIIVPEVGVTTPLTVADWHGTSTLVVARGPLNLADRATKRLLDIMLTVPVLIALLPLLTLVALAIKLDSPGPVFFSQQRIGRGNRLFQILKFRSMRTEQADKSGNVSASRDDDRVTRVGRFIRRTSIDELPQLINVLLGEMSLVGPRPHALGSTAEDALFWQVDRQYWHRHACKPGITGLAQIRGLRGATETRGDIVRRIEADLEYLHRWSLAGDLAILVRTASVLVHKKAF